MQLHGQVLWHPIPVRANRSLAPSARQQHGAYSEVTQDAKTVKAAPDVLVLAIQVATHAAPAFEKYAVLPDRRRTECYRQLATLTRMDQYCYYASLNKTVASWS